MVRYNQDGSVDTQFGATGGIISLYNATWTPALAILPNGSILVAGSTIAQYPNGFYGPRQGVLEIINSDGLGGSELLTDPGVTDVEALAVDSNNSVVALEISLPHFNSFDLRRYGIDIDSITPVNGGTFVDPSGFSPSAIAFDPYENNDFIFVAGSAGHASGGSDFAAYGLSGRWGLRRPRPDQRLWSRDDPYLGK